MSSEQLNMRTDSVVLEIFKDTAKARGISQKDLFTELVNDHKQGKSVPLLEAVKKELEKQVEEKNIIIDKQAETIRNLQNRSNISPEDLVTISFKVPREYAKKLSSKAITLDIPRNKLLTILIPNEEVLDHPALPQLENIESKTS